MNTTLRGAHSTPYILGRVEECLEKENEPRRSNRMLNSDEFLAKINSVHFNAGCSSSSTDLNTLVQFYNESADPEIIRQWMNVYQEHKNSNNPSHESTLKWQKEKNYSDSADNLNSKSGTEKDPQVSAPQKTSFNRSMDAIQGPKDGFFALSKCYSADFPTRIEMPTSRLIRSKEMPDITDVDDSDEY